MTTRVNLAPNPACKVNSTGWASTPSGWARSTSLDADMVRTTGFEGSAGGDVNTPRCAVTAGQQYVWSVQITATGGALSANMLINYYTATSGGSFVANSGPTVPLNLASGATARFELGPYTVPATAAAGLLKLNDLDAGAEVTAYMVMRTTELGRVYFDGDTPGAVWDGADGNSTSTYRIADDAVTFGETWTVAATADGPVFTDTATVAESHSIAAAGSFADAAVVADGFLIASLSFDASRGRVRIEAFTFAPSVATVLVQRRSQTSATWHTVRGGAVPVSGGRMTRSVDDYEYPNGVATVYRIQGLADDGRVVQSAQVARAAVEEPGWIKFVAKPSLNRPVTITGWSEIERSGRLAVYDVQDSNYPVVVSGVAGPQTVTVELKTETVAETKALDEVLRKGLPVYLHVPETLALPSMYAVIDGYRRQQPRPRSLRAIWDVRLIEVAAPPPSVIGAGTTWQNVADTYPTWGDLLASGLTWGDLAD